MSSNFTFWLLFVVVCGWFAFYYWSRRNIYRAAAKLPGPRGFPIIGSAHLFRSVDDVAESLMNIVQHYGPTAKLWMFNVLVVCITNPKHVQIALNSSSCLEKEKRYNLAKEAYGDGLLTAPAHIWKIHRKIIGPTFNQKILDSFVEVFVQQSRILVEQLEKEVGLPDFDMHDYMSRCAMDMICETAMGIGVEAQTKPSHFLHATRRAGQLLIERISRPWLHSQMIFKYSQRGQEFYKLLEFAHNFTGKLVMKRHQEFQKEREQQPVFEDNQRKPFLEHLLTLGEDLTNLELRNEVDVFITAGTDTVTTVCCYVLVCMGMHQEIQETVAQELDDVFGSSNRLLTVEDLPKLVYLERVIKETMRLYAPVPLIARSVTKDVDLGDFVLPADSALVIGIIGIHRDPEVYPNPMKFDPDRFLPEEVAKRHSHSFIPFSAGPRNCIGSKYAMMAMKVILASVLRTYKFDTNMKPETIRLCVEVVSRMIGGSNVRVTKR